MDITKLPELVTIKNNYGPVKLDFVIVITLKLYVLHYLYV